MLIVDHNITFEATASINLEALQASFGVFCRLLPVDELDSAYKRWVGEPAQYAKVEPFELVRPEVAPSLTDRQFIDMFLVGFADDVRASDGTPLEFTPDNVSRMLNIPGARIAVIDAFLRGYEKAEEKNSEPLPAGS